MVPSQTRISVSLSPICGWVLRAAESRTNNPVCFFPNTSHQSPEDPFVPSPVLTSEVNLLELTYEHEARLHFTIDHGHHGFVDHCFTGPHWKP